MGDENEKTGPKMKEIAPFCQGKKKTLPEATTALSLAKRLRQSWHLLKIWSARIIRNSLEASRVFLVFQPSTYLARVLPLPLASLPRPIILLCRLELNSTERRVWIGGTNVSCQLKFWPFVS